MLQSLELIKKVSRQRPARVSWLSPTPAAPAAGGGHLWPHVPTAALYFSMGIFRSCLSGLGGLHSSLCSWSHCFSLARYSPICTEPHTWHSTEETALLNFTPACCCLFPPSDPFIQYKAITLLLWEWAHLICWDSAVRVSSARLLPRDKIEPFLAGTA